MLVRYATEAHAAPAAELVRRSITALCSADYRGDPEILARWLAATTAADVRRWIASDDRAVCVLATPEGPLAAVGMVAWRGEIVLNYVAPEARFRGASKALMAHMESLLRDRGVAQARLFSTQVARRFYRALGYAEIGARESRYGTLDVMEMTKRLAA